MKRAEINCMSIGYYHQPKRNGVNSSLNSEGNTDFISYTGCLSVAINQQKIKLSLIILTGRLICIIVD